MKLRVRYGSRLVRKGYAGWVLFPFIFFRDAKTDVSDRLFRHEMQHVYQILAMGWLKFYTRYLWYLFKYGYKNHPYELDARAHENDPLTTVERYFKDL